VGKWEAGGWKTEKKEKNREHRGRTGDELGVESRLVLFVGSTLRGRWQEWKNGQRWQKDVEQGRPSTVTRGQEA